MMNRYLIKIMIMSIGQKLQQKEIIRLNLEKKLVQKILRKYGMGIKKKINLKPNILELGI